MNIYRSTFPLYSENFTVFYSHITEKLTVEQADVHKCCVCWL